MRITSARHAKQRMIQRKVGDDQVTETLASPDELISGESGEEIAVKRFGGREVRIVYRETADGSYLSYTVMKSRVPG